MSKSNDQKLVSLLEFLGRPAQSAQDASNVMCECKEAPKKRRSHKTDISQTPSMPDTPTTTPEAEEKPEVESESEDTAVVTQQDMMDAFRAAVTTDDREKQLANKGKIKAFLAENKINGLSNISEKDYQKAYDFAKGLI